MNTGEPLHHILRIHLPEECMDRRTAEVMDYCRRTGCSEVWLFTSSYDLSPSFAPIDEIARYCDLLRTAMRRFRAEGIEPAINVLQTLGHVYFPMELQEDFPFQRRVSSDGRLSREGACPLCPRLREWVVESYSLYADLKASTIWVDDDYRSAMQGLTCFCDLHLDRIGAMAGRSVTREDVVGALKDPTWPASGLRRFYHDATTAGFCELAEVIRTTVHERSPGTRIGLMAASLPAGTMGMDIARIAKTLAGDSRPLLRPQMPMYSEGFLRDMPRSLIATDQMRAMLPDEVEHYPEIENYTYTGYSNSSQFSFVKIATQVLMGFDHIAVNAFPMFGTSLELADGRLIETLERKKGFLDRLHQLVPEGSPPIGLRLYRRPENSLVHRVSAEASDNYREWMDPKVLAGRLPNLGLPVTWGRESPWVFLSGDDVLSLDDGELDALLKSGAVMDVRAAEALGLRGMDNRIGAKIGGPIPRDEIGYEHYGRTGMSPVFGGECSPLHALSVDGDWKYMTAVTASSVAASSIFNYRRVCVAPALLLTENADGERFAVLACEGTSDRLVVENPMRAEQLRNTFAWVARRPLPVAMHAGPYLWPIVNRTAEGATVLGIVNLSTDTYTELAVLWGGDSIPCSIRRLSDIGELDRIEFHAGEIDSGGTPVRVSLPMAPLDFTVLLVE